MPGTKTNRLVETGLMIIVICCMLFHSALAQVVQWSTYLNTPGDEYLAEITKDNNGDIYVLGNTNGTSFPVSAGAYQSTLTGNTTKLTITKLSGLNGSLIWSTYLGGENDVVIPRKIYWDAPTNTVNVIGVSKSDNFPVVNGNPKAPGTIFSPTFSQFNAGTGGMIYSTFVFLDPLISLGGNTISFRTEFDNGSAYFLGVDITNFKKIFISKISIAAHQFVYQTQLSGSTGFFNNAIGIYSFSFVIDNGEVFISGVTTATDYPTTAGAYQPVFPAGAAQAFFITRLTTGGQIGFSTFTNSYVDQSGLVFRNLAVNNNQVALGGSFRNGIPVSAGGVPFNNFDDNNLGVLKLNKINGSLIYFTYLGPGSGFSAFISGVKYAGNDLIIYGNSENAYLPVTSNATQFYNSYHVYNGLYAGDCFIAHLDASNHLVYCSYFGGNETESFSGITVDGPEVYLLGTTSSNNIPVTANATQAANKNTLTNNGGGELMLVKYNTASRSVTYSSYLGSNVYDNYYGTSALTQVGEDIYVNPGANCDPTHPITNDFPVTADAFQKSMTGITTSAIHQYIAKINTASGKLNYGSYLGSLPTGNGETGRSFLVNGDDIILSGTTTSNDYPITTGAVRPTYAGNTDVFITKLTLCYDNISGDTLIPKTQLVCAGSLVDSITGSVPQFAGTPVILRNGVAQSQANLTSFSYQWQESNDSSSWTYIAGAVKKDYYPLPVSAKKYFRRIATGMFCNNSDTSSVSVVDLNGFTGIKPDVGQGGTFVSCPGNNLTLGTAAVPGAIYSWQPAAHLNLTNSAQVIFNNSAAGAYTYTLSLADANGCVSADTATVFNYAANAGPNRVICQGQPVPIGGLALAGIAGVVYVWSPAAGLSCFDCAQPLASVPGTYILNVSVPVSSGLPCFTADTVIVGLSTLPVNPAGPDQTTCNELPLTLGTPRVPGYTYNWSPGIFLSAVSDVDQPVFNALSATLEPLYNPLSFVLTATNPAGCTVMDTAKIYLVNVSAGSGGCRPVQLGKPDFTLGAATYEWVDVSSGVETPVAAGELSSTSISNPVALAKPLITTTRTYRVKMTWNGVTCNSEISVGISCGCPKPDLHFLSASGCPEVAPGDSVTLYVAQPNPDYIYSWSPATGLNTTIGTSVKTGATTSIIYVVTATNIYDNTQLCTNSIKVNFFNTSAPFFHAPDTTICSGQLAHIGLPAVAGLDYSWSSSASNGAVLFTTSDPEITGTSDVIYYVLVTDPITGCNTRDTINVYVPSVTADAGPSRQACTNGGFTLGIPATAGLVYSWTPATGLNNPNIAQPVVVLNTADIIYVLHVTDPATGCTATSITSVEHVDNPSLAPIPAPAPYCEGSNFSVQIGNPALSGVTYSWSPGTGLNDPSLAQPVASPLSTTTYTLTAGFTGCASTATAAVIVTVTPKPEILPSVINSCINSQLNVVTNAATPIYTWSPGYALTSTGIPNPVSTSSIPFIYTINIYDQASGCSNSAIVNVVPPVSANAGADKEYCVGGTAPLGAPPVAGITYLWTPAAGISNAAISNPVTSGSLAAGIYTYTLTASSGGCTKTDSVLVRVNPAPDVNIPAGIVICQGAAVQIGNPGQPGITYNWSPALGLSNASIANPVATPLATTTYTLTAANIVSGCSAQASVTITVNTTGALAVSATGANICPGDTAQLLANVAGSGLYTYTWTPPVGFSTSQYISNPRVLPPVTTTYQVLITNTANGCASTATAIVTVIDSCNLVPVTWLSFDAVLRNGKTLLDWRVGMEENNNEFVVERSKDGLQWKDLFSIAGKGNTNLPRSYNAVDNAPPAGTDFYRIRQVNADGHFTFSVIRSVKNIAGSSQFTVYPNPAQDIISYELLNAGSVVNKKLLLYAVDGRLINQISPIESRGAIMVGDLPPGVYILLLKDKYSGSESKKIIIRR